MSTTLPLAAEIVALLKTCSTATVSTQLFKRGLRNTFIQGVPPLGVRDAVMVGPAYTLRYIPAREDIDHLGVFDRPGHPQRVAIEECPPGAVLVMDCRGEASAASGGGILLTRLMIRGVAGLVTDGGLRDSPEIARLAMPVYCRAPNPLVNLIKHHATDLNVPIGCGGVAVYPGDVLVGDAEGVVVIPRHLADEVARDAAEQERMERFIMAEIESGRALPGTYPPDEATRARYEAWKARGGA
jgi:regulator of RNase E activity RraA